LSHIDSIKHTKYIRPLEILPPLKSLKFRIVPKILLLYKLFAAIIFFIIVLIRTFIFVLMEVNTELVNNIAHLARLHFTDEEKKEIEKDLQRMISFVEKLNEIDTTDIKPLQHMSSAINVLREDELKGSVSRNEALINAPVTDGVFFKVPKVIKK